MAQYSLQMPIDYNEELMFFLTELKIEPHSINQLPLLAISIPESNISITFNLYTYISVRCELPLQA